MTDRSTITQILAMLAFRCPGRDPLTEIAKNAGSGADDMRESMILFWLDQLQDLDECTLLAATRDLCGAPGQWAPSVGDIRQRAVELSLGHLAPPSAGEAWGRVCKWARGEPVQLTDAEKSAAKRAGGTWELKHSENVTTTRAHFLRFYDEEIRKFVMTRRAHPETRQLADGNRPAMLESVHINPSPHYLGPVAATPQQIRELLKGLNGYEPRTDTTTNRDAGADDPVAPTGTRQVDTSPATSRNNGADGRDGRGGAPDQPGQVSHSAERGGGKTASR